MKKTRYITTTLHHFYGAQLTACQVTKQLLTTITQAYETVHYKLMALKELKEELPAPE